MSPRRSRCAGERDHDGHASEVLDLKLRIAVLQNLYSSCDRVLDIYNVQPYVSEVSDWCDGQVAEDFTLISGNQNDRVLPASHQQPQ